MAKTVSNPVSVSRPGSKSSPQVKAPQVVVKGKGKGQQQAAPVQPAAEEKKERSNNTEKSAFFNLHVMTVDNPNASADQIGDMAEQVSGRTVGKSTRNTQTGIARRVMAILQARGQLKREVFNADQLKRILPGGVPAPTPIATE
jgi:hypothetical protein